MAKPCLFSLIASEWPVPEKQILHMPGSDLSAEIRISKIQLFGSKSFYFGWKPFIRAIFFTNFLWDETNEIFQTWAVFYIKICRNAPDSNQTPKIFWSPDLHIAKKVQCLKNCTIWRNLKKKPKSNFVGTTVLSIVVSAPVPSSTTTARTSTSNATAADGASDAERSTTTTTTSAPENAVDGTDPSTTAKSLATTDMPYGDNLFFFVWFHFIGNDGVESKPSVSVSLLLYPCLSLSSKLRVLCLSLHKYLPIGRVSLSVR